MSSGEVLLAVTDLTVRYQRRSGWLPGRRTSLAAVDRLSFTIRRGETFGLVGESGCGKSSVGRALLRLQEPTGGSVAFDGVELTSLSKGEMRRYRRRMQMVFQDSFSSLNPYMRVGEILAEPMTVFGIATPRERRARALQLLQAVGLPPDVAARYPHEFSGGQRQRINIARALALEPQLVVCDEPVSALDVSIQAQIVELLRDLQARLGLTYLFISHDLAVVREICHRVGIMYLGRLCEITSSDELYEAPLHPYTRALLSAIPIPDPVVEAEREKARVVLAGEVPDATRPPVGCRFSGRCPLAAEVGRRHGIDCAAVEPHLAEAQPGRWVACHAYPTSRPH